MILKYDGSLKSRWNHRARWLRKKIRRQGGRILRNEAHLWCVAVTKDEAQRSIRTFYEVIKYGTEKDRNIMGKPDVTQIRIKGNLIGIVGLREEMEKLAQRDEGKTEGDVAEELFRAVSEKNYIPESAKGIYREALLEEYLRFRENPDQTPTAGEGEVIILGPGCARCDLMEREVREVMAELGIAGELRHVTDAMEIARWGVMGTPALVVRGRVVSVGAVPERDQLKTFLADLAEGCETKGSD